MSKQHRPRAISLWRPDGEYLVCRDCGEMYRAPRRERMKTADLDACAAKEADRE